MKKKKDIEAFPQLSSVSPHLYKVKYRSWIWFITGKEFIAIHCYDCAFGKALLVPTCSSVLIQGSVTVTMCLGFVRTEQNKSNNNKNCHLNDACP